MRSAPENLALSIVERLQKAGHVAYFAGGCVRDRIMGRVPKDYDVATSAVPEQVLAIFPHSQQVGVAFGVVLVRQGRGGVVVQVEVATFRADGDYSDGRRPDSVRFTDAREDAQRRDFTCNGLFFDPLADNGRGTLHDFIGGQADIEAKLLRAIGDPSQRFAEDHLRMLRAIRFAGKLGFAIEPATWEAIRRNAANITGISRERIGGELRLILAHASRARSMELLRGSGLLAHLWTEAILPRQSLAALPPDTGFVPALVQAHRMPRDPNARPTSVAAMLQERFALSNDETADFLWLLRQLTETIAPAGRLDRLRISTLKRLMADHRWPALLMLHRVDPQSPGMVAAEDALLARLQAEGVAPVPFISGDTLISLGAKPGPLFRKWLEELYDRQLEGEIRTSEQAVFAANRLMENA